MLIEMLNRATISSVGARNLLERYQRMPIGFQGTEVVLRKEYSAHARSFKEMKSPLLQRLTFKKNKTLRTLYEMYPLNAAIRQDPLVPFAVTVLHGSGEHISDRLEAPVRMIRETGDVIGAGIGFEFIEQEKGIQKIEPRKSQASPETDSRSVGRLLRFDHPNYATKFGGHLYQPFSKDRGRTPLSQGTAPCSGEYSGRTKWAQRAVGRPQSATLSRPDQECRMSRRGGEFHRGDH